MTIETLGAAARAVTVLPGSTVGRHPDNTVVLVDPRVSGFHFQLVQDESGKMWVLDRGSSNGTQVVGGALLKAEQRAPIQDGMQLRLGDTRIIFRSASNIEATIVGGPPVDFAKTGLLGRTPPPEEKEPEAQKEEQVPRVETPAEPSSKAQAPKKAKPDVPASDKKEEAVAPKATEATPEAKEAPAVPPAVKKPVEKVAKEPKPPAARVELPKDHSPADELFDGDITKPSDEKPRARTPSNPTVALEGIRGGLAAIAEFRTAMARIVISTESLKERFDITMVDMTIGRSRSSQNPVDLRLEHDAVSSQHARIKFVRGQFILEDLGSKNGTYIEEERLSAGAPRMLKSNQAIRLGTVTGLFVTEVDERGVPIDRKLYDDALSILESEETIVGLIAKRVRADASSTKSHPGEVLILEGRITPDQWSDAVRRAPFLKVARHQVAKGWREPRFVVMALAFLLLAFTLVYFFLR
jgi:pSer/pThr/pTyr-binding forkhead associated (FHA) protein